MKIWKCDISNAFDWIRVIYTGITLNLDTMLLLITVSALINPLTPKITDFLTHFWPLSTKRKPCIHNVFGSPLLIYEVKITLACTGKPIWLILFLKVAKIWNFFKILFLFKWIKHIDLFETMDKDGQNSCSLWKKLFGPAPYVISFPKLRKTMEIWKNTRFFMTFLK